MKKLKAKLLISTLLLMTTFALYGCRNGNGNESDMTQNQTENTTDGMTNGNDTDNNVGTGA